MTPIRVVIGGGIGSGKSAVGDILAGRGFAVLDADRVGHRVLGPDHRVTVEVAVRWPEAVVDGQIDRARLARIVFADPAQLEELENLTHPAIREAIARWSTEMGDRPAAVEMPIMANLVDENWVWIAVDVPTEQRKERLRSRGMAERDIEARMAAQPTREEWRVSADHLIDNSGVKQSLQQEIDRLITSLQSECAD